MPHRAIDIIGIFRGKISDRFYLKRWYHPAIYIKFTRYMTGLLILHHSAHVLVNHPQVGLWEEFSIVSRTRDVTKTNIDARKPVTAKCL